MTHGKQLSKKMLEIIRAAQWLKSHAYDQTPNEHATLKMQELVILVREGQELMAGQEVIVVEEPMMAIDLEDSVENTTTE
jgi:hypothetical protein